MDRLRHLSWILLASCQPAMVSSPSDTSGPSLVEASSSDPAVYDVIVLGADLPGLVAAERLLQTDLEHVLVLGAPPQPETVPDTFTTAGQDAVLRLLEDLDLTVSMAPLQQCPRVLIEGHHNDTEVQTHMAQVVSHWTTLLDEVPLDAPWNAPHAAAWDSHSVAWWLEQDLLTSGLSDTHLALEAQVTETLGTSSEDVSMLWWLSYLRGSAPTARGAAPQTWRIDGGGQQLTSALLDRLGDRVWADAQAAHVTQGEAGATVQLTSGETVHADRVLIALSTSQAQQLTFSPALPAPRAELHAHWPTADQGFKVSLAYERPFWRDEGDRSFAYLDHGPVSWVVDSSPFDASAGVLMAFVDGDHTNRNEAARRHAVLAAVETLFGEDAGAPIAYAEQARFAGPRTHRCGTPLPPGFLTTWGMAMHSPFGRIHWASAEMTSPGRDPLTRAVRAGQRAASEVQAAQHTD